jgi:hypothetical protein
VTEASNAAIKLYYFPNSWGHLKILMLPKFNTGPKSYNSQFTKCNQQREREREREILGEHLKKKSLQHHPHNNDNQSQTV